MNQPLLQFSESRIQHDRARLNAGNQRPHGGKDRCPHCQASMMEHRHVLSKGLAECLIRLYRFGKPATLKQLAFGSVKNNNFQKLRYLGLAERVDIDEQLTGRWVITDLGEQFVRCSTSAPYAVWTYRNKVVEVEKRLVTINDLLPDWRYRINYATEARSHVA